MSSKLRKTLTISGKPNKDNLLYKLFSREIFGSVRNNGKRNGRLVTRIPGRLAFCLNDIIPESALLSGHIFLGFSKCGQFLISYTQFASDTEGLESMETYYNYRLTWWSFLPYSRAKKVSEIPLFSNNGAPPNLNLSFCQWNLQNGRALIYGLPSYIQDGEPSINCYLTITSVPSLQGCKACKPLSECLKHGMTIHTSFNLLPPHPKFQPRISMKRDGVVVINTGNILHCLSVDVVSGRKESKMSSFDSSPSVSQVNTPSSKSSSLLSSTLNFKKGRLAAAEKAYAITEQDFESEGVSENISTFRRKRLADKKYELRDDDFESRSILSEKLSSFRKKQRRDKFEKNNNNTTTPRRTSIPSNRETENESQVKTLISACQILRPLTTSEFLPQLLSPGEMIHKHNSCSPLPKMHLSFTRFYVDDDSNGEENEDEFLLSEFYHSALPLEVHGSGYRSLSMISKSREGSLRVSQISLDLECFCLDMAQKLCLAADRNYWFCNDYDVEIVDVNDAEVYCVAVLQVQATLLNSSSVTPNDKISSLHRRQYQGGFKFSWNMDLGITKVFHSDPLCEISDFKRESQIGIWHPARSTSSSLQRQFGLASAGIKVVTNDPFLRGASLKTIVDSEHVIAIILDNINNYI